MIMAQKFETRSSKCLLSVKTLADVDQFLKAEMRGETCRGRKYQDSSGFQNASKFIVDGYGRWREVSMVKENASLYEGFLSRQEDINDRDICASSYMNNDRSSCVPRNTLRQQRETGSARINDQLDASYNNERLSMTSDVKTRPLPSRRGTTESYKHLSTSLRSNVFPGKSKQDWQSSTKTAFEPKAVPASWAGPDHGFGVRKDSFMVWSEYDVYRQRLMRAWDKYQQELPKQERTADMNVQKIEKPKEKPAAKPKIKTDTKKRSSKPKPQVQQQKPENDKPKDIQPTRIEVQPAPSDDDFWDFYEQPFAQS